MPLILAGAAITLLAGYFITGPHAPNLIDDHGIMREDEGITARLWQIVMVLQVGSILIFAALWLPRDTKRAATMLMFQALGLVAAAAPVYLLEHGYLG
jgi:hypothetical protein